MWKYTYQKDDDNLFWNDSHKIDVDINSEKQTDGDLLKKKLFKVQLRNINPSYATSYKIVMSCDQEGFASSKMSSVSNWVRSRGFKFTEEKTKNSDWILKQHHKFEYKIFRMALNDIENYLYDNSENHSLSFVKKADKLSLMSNTDKFKITESVIEFNKEKKAYYLSFSSENKIGGGVAFLELEPQIRDHQLIYRKKVKSKKINN